MNLIIESARVPLSGNNGLSEAMIVRPVGVDTYPCILIRTPYPRVAALTANDGLTLAATGYVVVVQSSRGRHGTDGRFTAFLHEEEDGATSLNWCICQQWCNGRIFLMGKSYEGLAAWAALKASPSLVTGLVVSMTASQPVHWFYEAGAFRQSFAQSWGLSLAYTDETNEAQLFEVIREYARDLARLYAINPCESPLLGFLPGYSDWLEPAQLTRLGRDYVRNRTAPVHMMTGWNDIFVRGALADATDLNVLGDRIIIGPWSHNTVGQRIVGHVDYGVYATTGEFDVCADRLAWMATVLSGERSGGVSYFVLNSWNWEHCHHWPPSTRLITLPLALEDELGTLGESLIPSSGIRLSRSTLVLSPGGRVHDPLLPLAGGFRFTDISDSPSTVLFATPLLAQQLNLAGAVRVRLVISCQESFPLTAWLALRTPDDKYLSLATGFHWVTKAQEPQPIQFEFSEIAVQLPVASQFVVAFACSSWPEVYSPELSTISAYLLNNDSMQLELSIVEPN